MFGRKKKPQWKLRLLDGRGTALYDGPMSELELPEDVVLRLSVEFFDDPEPCHIHRSAVHSRACLELGEALVECGAVRLTSLPEPVRRYLAAFADADTVELITD